MRYMKDDFKDYTKIKNNIEGKKGEIKAVLFLKKHGYKILETNFKNKIGEIDIIAEKDGVIVFIEVKNRSTYRFGRPIEAVDFRKQSKIKKVAEIYLMIKNKYYNDVRFDVVEVSNDNLEHIENAFM